MMPTVTGVTTMSFTKSSYFNAALLALLCATANVHATQAAAIDNATIENIADPVAKGIAITRETDRRDSGFGDYSVEADMILMQQNKVVSQRSFFSKILEIAGDGDHSVNVFRSPREVEGTAILIYSHGLVPDDQWLYLPAVKRVKRISSRSKSGPFVGSEFAYEDISTWVPEKYTYRF
jgi:hypothetical protein